jgi:FtsH-binding integral membrane protein
MLAGLALTGVAVLTVLNTPLGALFFTFDPSGKFITGMSILGWIALFAPLGMVFFLSFRIQSMSFSSAQITFWVFAAVMGIGLAPIFLMYTGASVARVFFITSATFGAMSLWGYTTKRDLTGWGSFLFMGLIGIIIASLVNMFMQSSMMEFVISVIGVIIFTGLTAYDTQKIKESYSVSMSGEIAGKTAIMGALRLYLDFINLFLMLLRLLGARR